MESSRKTCGSRGRIEPHSIRGQVVSHPHVPNGFHFDQVDWPPQHSRQIVFQRDEVERVHPRARQELDDEIHVTRCRIEISLTSRRSGDIESSDAIAPAERLYGKTLLFEERNHAAKVSR